MYKALERFFMGNDKAWRMKILIKLIDQAMATSKEMVAARRPILGSARPPPHQRDHVLKYMQKEMGIDANTMLEIMDRVAMSFEAVRELNQVHGRPHNGNKMPV